MRTHGPWTIHESRSIYRDPWLHVVRDEVTRPDGDPGSHCVVHIKPGVCVLAMDDERNVYLTEEFHYAVGRVTVECVSGGIEPGEEALNSAQRELEEELGISARDWLDLGIVDPFTAMLLSPTWLYLARSLTFGVHAQEGTEQIECLKMSLEEAIAAVMDSRITHAPSCVAILKVATLRIGA